MGNLKEKSSRSRVNSSEQFFILENVSGINLLDSGKEKAFTKSLMFKDIPLHFIEKNRFLWSVNDQEMSKIRYFIH